MSEKRMVLKGKLSGNCRLYTDAEIELPEKERDVIREALMEYKRILGHAKLTDSVKDSIQIIKSLLGEEPEKREGMSHCEILLKNKKCPKKRTSKIICSNDKNGDCVFPIDYDDTKDEIEVVDEVEYAGDLPSCHGDVGVVSKIDNIGVWSKRWSVSKMSGYFEHRLVKLIRKAPKVQAVNERTNLDDFVDISQLDTRSRKFMENTCQKCSCRKISTEKEKRVKALMGLLDAMYK